MPRAPTWLQLSALGENRLVRSSYFWFVAVPIAAKVLQHVPAELKFSALGARFTLFFGLPFSWEVLFFAAVTFSFGNLLYGLSCPAFIHQYPDYGVFAAHGSSDHEILRALRGLWLKGGHDPEKAAFATPATQQSASAFLEAFSPIPSTQSPRIPKELFWLNIDSASLAKAFWVAHAALNTSRDAGRWAVTIAYSLGLALSGWVVVSNIYSVVLLMTSR